MSKIRANKLDVILKKHPKLEGVIREEIDEKEADMIHVVAVEARNVAGSIEQKFLTQYVKYDRNFWLTKLKGGERLALYVAGQVLEVLHDGMLHAKNASKAEVEPKAKAEKAEKAEKKNESK